MNGAESFVVQNNLNGPGSIVDVSAFFSRYHLPKLQTLHLYGRGIPLWNVLKSQTAALTTLELKIPDPPHGFTPDIADNDIPLHNLEKLELGGEFHHAF